MKRKRSEHISIDIDEKGNIVSMTIEHAKLMQGSGSSHIERYLAKLYKTAERRERNRGRGLRVISP